MSAPRVGLVGYGDAGRGLHAPLLAAAGLDLAVVATADPGRSAAVRAEVPGARVVPDLAALLAERVDLVVLASPTGAHADQALACVRAGVPVVVDKPLAVDAASVAAVVRAAAAAGVPLTVFHNRRWDAEQLTLARLLAEGTLGEVFAFERRWERWRPVPKDRWRENAAPADGGGLLLDLGPHLVDAAVQLLGPVTHVYAEVAARTTRAEDDVLLACTHAGGARSRLQAGSLVGAPGPRTRVLARRGSYVATGFEGDPGAFAGLEDVPGHTGWVVAGDQRTPVPTAPGEQADFYRAVAAALAVGRAGGEVQAAMPVQPGDAVHTAAVLDAARASAARLAVVPVEAAQAVQLSERGGAAAPG